MNKTLQAHISQPAPIRAAIALLTDSAPHADGLSYADVISDTMGTLVRLGYECDPGEMPDVYEVWVRGVDMTPHLDRTTLACLRNELADLGRVIQRVAA